MYSFGGPSKSSACGGILFPISFNPKSFASELI